MSLRNHKLAIKLDSVGTAASMICAIHCAVLPLIMVVFTLYGYDFISGPLFEFVFISASVLIGLFTLTHGYRNHHKSLVPSALFISGLVIIVVSHSFFHHNTHSSQVVFGSLESIFTPIGAFMIGAGHFVNRKYSKKLVASECCK